MIPEKKVKNISKRNITDKTNLSGLHLFSSFIVEETTPIVATTPGSGSHIIFMCKYLEDDFI